MNILSLCNVTIPTKSEKPSHREVFDTLSQVLPVYGLSLESLKSYEFRKHVNLVLQNNFEFKAGFMTATVLVSSSSRKHPFVIEGQDLNVKIESISF